MAIVLWIGIVITAQAFQATPREHAPAVVVGLLPGVAAWGALMLKNGLRAAGMGPAGGEPFDAEQLIDGFLGSRHLGARRLRARAGLHLHRDDPRRGDRRASSSGASRAPRVWCARRRGALRRSGSCTPTASLPPTPSSRSRRPGRWVIGYAAMAAIFLVARFVTVEGREH